MKPTLFIFFVCALLGLKNCADRYEHEQHWKNQLEIARASLSPAQLTEFIEQNEGEPEPWRWPSGSQVSSAGVYFFHVPNGGIPIDPPPTARGLHSFLHAIAFVHDGKRKVIQTTEVNQ